MKSAAEKNEDVQGNAKRGPDAGAHVVSIEKQTVNDWEEYHNDDVDDCRHERNTWSQMEDQKGCEHESPRGKV